MFKIADNPMIRDQIKRSSVEAGISKHSDAETSAEAGSLKEAEKSLVLEGGRYYAADTKK